MNLTIYEDKRYLISLFDEDELFIKQNLKTNLEELKIQIKLLSIINKALISLLPEGLSTLEISDIIRLAKTTSKIV